MGAVKREKGWERAKSLDDGFADVIECCVGVVDGEGEDMGGW